MTTDLVELEPHQGLNQGALPSRLLAHDQDRRRIEGLLEVLWSRIEQQHRVGVGVGLVLELGQDRRRVEGLLEVLWSRMEQHMWLRLGLGLGLGWG